MDEVEFSPEAFEKFQAKIEQEAERESIYSPERDERKVHKKLEYFLRAGKKDNLKLNHKGDNKKFKFINYSCLRGIPCSVGEHKNTIDSRFILSSNNFDYFDFAFCKKCLFDLVITILDFYHNEDIQFSREGKIVITTEAAEKVCFSCGSEKSKYEITIGNKTFVMCKKCFDKFCENVMSSQAVKEIFRTCHNEFFKKVNQEIQQEKNEFILEKLFAPEDEKKIYAFALNKFGAENIDHFSYIHVENINCSFCNNENRPLAKVVLGTNRVHNVLSLAYCPDCAKRINEVIRESIKKCTTSQNESNDLKTYVKCMFKNSIPKNDYCFICGTGKGNAYRITHSNCSFTLCAKCVKKYVNQLKMISEIE